MNMAEIIGIGISLLTMFGSAATWAAAVLWKLAQLVSEVKSMRADLHAHNVTIEGHRSRLDNHEVRLVKLEGS